MTHKEERINYAMSFQCKGMDNEELKEIIRLAVLDGATWADKTMINKAVKWLEEHMVGWNDDFVESFKKAMK